MNKFSLKSLAVVAITALLLAILAVPVMAAGEGSPAGSSGTSVGTEQSAPYAAYTKRRRAKKVVRRRVRRTRRRVVRRKRRVVKKVVAPVAPLAAAAPAPVVPVAAPVDETALAQTILDGLKAQYPRYLANVTVEFGNANGYQAISYYTIGRIVVSPTHTATLPRILDHEIWHIIDWQDNSQMNWGEAIPPANMGEYAN